MDDNKPFGKATLAVRTGHKVTAEGEHAEPIFPTSSFIFRSAEEAALRFSETKSGNIYSRFTNPTVSIFEKRLAAMENGERCIATASGMSAILTTCIGLLKTGDHIISSKNIFGTTKILFTKYLARMGIKVSFVNLTDLKIWQKTFLPETRMLFLETPSNPMMEIGNITALSNLAHTNGAIIVVDNCFCTPILQRPLELGADIVIHSTTKYIDGQGRCIGGAIVGDNQLIGKDIYGVLRTTGPTMSPFNAWVFLKSLETLEIRMRKHCDNAQRIAEWLNNHPAIVNVYYPGLTSHPQRELIQRQQDAPGGILSFEIRGGKKMAWRLIDRLRLISITANLGDAKTTITHPASTTHSRLTKEARREVGITSGLIRVSVGLENVKDLINDLKQALMK